MIIMCMPIYYHSTIPIHGRVKVSSDIVKYNGKYNASC